MHCALHLHPAMTKICATRSRFCGFNDRFAVNFRGEFPCKIVPCPGAGHGGYNDISLVSTSVSKGIQRKQMLLTLYCATFNVKLAYVMLRAPVL